MKDHLVIYNWNVCYECGADSIVVFEGSYEECLDYLTDKNRAHAPVEAYTIVKKVEVL